jgi:hypothetical protein
MIAMKNPQCQQKPAQDDKTRSNHAGHGGLASVSASLAEVEKTSGFFPAGRIE